MNTLDDHKKQLEDLRDHLAELGNHGPPSNVDWKEMSLALREDAIFLTEFILPKIEVPARYSSVENGHKIAQFDPAPAVLTEAEPQTGTPFLAPPRPGEPI